MTDQELDDVAFLTGSSVRSSTSVTSLLCVFKSNYLMHRDTQVSFMCLNI
jgi:hypothetical protein